MHDVSYTFPRLTISNGMTFSSYRCTAVEFREAGGCARVALYLSPCLLQLLLEGILHSCSCGGSLLGLNICALYLLICRLDLLRQFISLQQPGLQAPTSAHANKRREVVSQVGTKADYAIAVLMLHATHPTFSWSSRGVSRAHS